MSWEIAPTDKRPYATAIIDAPPGSMVAHGTICDVYGPPEERLANARLIVAARDLLEALKALRPYVASCIDGDDDPSIADLEEVDAAIAKAEKGGSR